MTFSENDRRNKKFQKKKRKKEQKKIKEICSSSATVAHA